MRSPRALVVRPKVLATSLAAVLFLPGELDQHAVGEVLDAQLAEHVDDLRERVVGVQAHVQQRIGAADEVRLAAAGGRAAALDLFVQRFGA